MTSAPEIKPSPPPVADDPQPLRRATFVQTLKAVLWGFFGVRKRRDLDSDATSVNPVHLILTGIGLAALFVVGLILLVRFITR